MIQQDRSVMARHHAEIDVALRASLRTGARPLTRERMTIPTYPSAPRTGGIATIGRSTELVKVRSPLGASTDRNRNRRHIN